MPLDGKIADYAKTDSVAEVLRKARALVDRPEKWTQESPFGSKKHCAGSALMVAEGLFDGWDGRLQDRDSARFLIEAAQMNYVCCMRGAIACWNDAPERTHADILNAFDRAIALAEADHD